jgi:hypothetical protein
VPLDINDPVVATAVFGKQVENFIDSDIGSYLMRRVKDEITDATRDLTNELREPKVIDPKFITAIQDRIRVAELVRRWLGAAIEEGIAALEQIKEEA